MKKSSKGTKNKINNFKDEHIRKIQSDSEFRALMEVSPDPVVVYDPEGQTIYANPAFEETYGWSFEELVGKRINFVPEKEMGPTLDAWRRTLAGEKIFFETRRFTKDGRILDIQMRTAILKKNERHILSIVIHRDVTSIKQAERDREKLIKELQNALSKVRILSGMLPICANCKKIRDDKGYWNQIETYIQSHTSAEFSHSICPECATKLYPELNLYDDD